jgi:putrescine---pyruvate transaminase
MAKGLTSSYIPMSAVGIGGRVKDVLMTMGEEVVHGYTYAGHPVAAAVAMRNIEIMQEEGLVERAGHDIGPYLQARLRELASHPLVGEVRGIGMIAAIEIVEHKPSRAHFDPKRGAGMICRNHCFANGLVMRAVRDTMVLAEVDTLVETAARCLDLTQRDLGR